MLITYSFLPTYPVNRKIKEILMHTRTTIGFTSQWRNVHERNAANLISSRVHHYYARWIHEYASIPSIVRLFFLTHYTTTYIRGLFFILRPTKKTRKQLQMGIFFSFRIRGFDFGFDSRGKHAISLSEKKPLDSFRTFASYITK